MNLRVAIKTVHRKLLKAKGVSPLIQLLFSNLLLDPLAPNPSVQLLWTPRSSSTEFNLFLWFWNLYSEREFEMKQQRQVSESNCSERRQFQAAVVGQSRTAKLQCLRHPKYNDSDFRSLIQ